MRRNFLQTVIFFVLVGIVEIAFTASSIASPTERVNKTLSYPVACPHGVLNQASINKIEALVEQTMTQNKIPGLAIGIVKNSQAVYSKGFGFANVVTGQPVTSGTVFQLGSDSKMMVGIAVMQLKEQGKINLDSPVTAYLPYFQLADQRYKKIILRYIMSHRSGLPWCSNNEQCDTLDYQSPQYDEGSLERHVRNLAQVKLDNPPGKKMQYSDLGFEIIGDIIAKVSGESFESYIQNHIFKPFGMQHSSFLIRDIPPEILAQPHILNPGLAVNDYFPYSRQHAPSSHLFSNVDDMNRFAIMLMTQQQPGGVKILSPAAFKTMWTPQISTNMPSPWEKKLGLGWFLGGKPGHRLVGHAGGDTGFTSDFIMAPDDGLAVTVMINLDYAVEDLAYQVMEILYALKSTEPEQCQKN